MAANLTELTDDTFGTTIQQATEPVLVDFWAPWCGPCKALTPTLEKLAGEFDGRFTIAKLDVQSYPQTAGAFGIRSIPALLFFKDGHVVDSLMGAVGEDRIRDKMEQVAER